MPKLNSYLNFDGQAEEAFNFYKSVFGGEFLGEIYKIGNATGTESLSDDEKNRVLHVVLPIGNDLLMGSDIIPSLGQTLQCGNGNYVSVSAESREEAEKIFNGLSPDGIIEIPLEDQLWGEYFGSLQDKFGVHWMVSFNTQ